MSQRALVFGISGQDGAYLARHLLSRGYEVVGTSRDAELSSFSNLRRLGIRDQVELDSVAINDFRSVLQCIDRARPAEIYNLAGQSSVGLSFRQPVETLESHVLASINILEALRLLNAPIRFYNACSSECFGNTSEGPVNEESPFRPRSPYALAKASAFWAVANYRDAYGLYACSGILANHESPLRPERFVTQKIVRAAWEISQKKAERVTLGDIGIRRDWGWAPEYVEAMHLMLRQPAAEDFIIATGETHSLEEFVAAAFEAVGLDYRAHVDIDSSLFRPSEIRESVMNPAKAAEKLNWRATKRMRDVVAAMMEGLA